MSRRVVVEAYFTFETDDTVAMAHDETDGPLSQDQRLMAHLKEAVPGCLPDEDGSEAASLVGMSMRVATSFPASPVDGGERA